MKSAVWVVAAGQLSMALKMSWAVLNPAAAAPPGATRLKLTPPAPVPPFE